jgi:hypothetical protein
MANFHSDEWIMAKVQEHYDEALKYFPEDRIVGIFAQGSPNYGLDYEDSDVDTKLIVLPTFEEICFNKKPHSTTHVCANEEHIDFKDLRLMLQTFRKQNLNFVEILFTPYKIVNPKYATHWDTLVKNNELIAHYNPYGAVKTMKGIAMEKFHAMEHEYPSKVDVLAEWGYDPKQLHHLLRVEDYLERYIAGESYEKCLRPADPEYLIAVKKGIYSLDEARQVGQRAILNVNHMAEEFYTKNENIEDPEVNALLDDVQLNIMRIAIEEEFKK